MQCQIFGLGFQLLAPPGDFLPGKNIKPEQPAQLCGFLFGRSEHAAGHFVHDGAGINDAVGAVRVDNWRITGAGYASPEVRSRFVHSSNASTALGMASSA